MSYIISLGLVSSEQAEDLLFDPRLENITIKNATAIIEAEDPDVVLFNLRGNYSLKSFRWINVMRKETGK